MLYRIYVPLLIEKDFESKGGRKRKKKKKDKKKKRKHNIMIFADYIN